MGGRGGTLEKPGERGRRYGTYIAECRGKKCMQIGVGGAKLGPNWASVDLYDESPTSVIVRRFVAGPSGPSTVWALDLAQM